ncbi:MAG TPA: hypothetical protein VHM25_14380 [Polyangiaceae bacterium]|jgi:hypothetical protein|nr:hypothetical protein [Polyangiaceae bacterium]
MKQVGMKNQSQWLLWGQAVLGLALSACAGPRMAAPADVSSSSDVLAVSERSQASGALVNEGFKLGPYEIADVDRKWDSSSGVSVGPWGKETKTTGFSFTLAGSKTKLKGKCESVLEKQSVLSFGGGSIDWGSTTIACNCEGAADKASLVLSKDANKLTVGTTDYPIQPVHSVVGGSEQSAPSGFRADSDGPLGAVEVLYPGQVWLKKGLDESTRSNLSCLFTGLMLYKPPSDH